jgi:serine/threonine protein kinase
VKLVDFGHAIISTPAELLSGAAITGRSQGGTPGYSAPELLTAGRHSSVAEVWSAGALLYLMLAGAFPFPQRPGPQQTRRILLGCPRAVLEEGEDEDGAWCDVSAEAKQLVRRMLTVSPRERITVAEVLIHPWILMYQRS